MSWVLIGYRGTGKSTVARLLAERLDVAWFDSDLEIERRAAKSIKEIFEADGEASFRRLEEEVIAELVGRGDAVLALGGGAILRAGNRRAIEPCHVVWLTARPRTLWARIAADPVTHDRRPNLTAAGGLDEIAALLRRRQPLYRRCADYVVATDERTPRQVVEEILGVIQ